MRVHAWPLYNNNNTVLNLMERTASERGRAFGLANSEAMVDTQGGTHPDSRRGSEGAGARPTPSRSLRLERQRPGGLARRHLSRLRLTEGPAATAAAMRGRAVTPTSSSRHAPGAQDDDTMPAPGWGGATNGRRRGGAAPAVSPAGLGRWGGKGLGRARAGVCAAGGRGAEDSCSSRGSAVAPLGLFD